jgi:hypothetical protein
MKRALLGLAGISCLVLASGALAEDAVPADKPSPKVGDVFEFVDKFVSIACKRWEVKEIDKDGYIISECGNNLAYLDAQTDTVAKIVTKDGSRLVEFKPRSPTLSFPLQVGKKWEGDYDGYRAAAGTSWKSHVTCEAKAFETVKTAAGEFPAYRIDCQDAWESTPFHGVADSTSWYAPKVGNIVKSVNPSQSAFEYELAGYAAK